jgi:DNA-binding NarL/FixJ family response regulator
MSSPGSFSRVDGCAEGRWRLPAEHRSPHDFDAGDNPVGGEDEGWQHGVMSTILIVDDHSAFRLEARQLLEAEGFVVIGEAADGQAALSLVARERPDVLLLDIGLPDIDGFAVADRLAAVQPSISVILTSSRDGSIYGSRISDTAAVGFLRKDELTGDAIRSLIGAA